ncbi:thioredoxin-disulfide reductase [Candidatus Woesearchaeota archaeon]|nr:MAG: thioredoxin-disulfide reductase [Candidatus Woesearchaeota archaeon]
MTDFDVAIIGAGAAGFSAGIYAARYNLKTVLYGAEMGGMTNLAHNIQNFPGFEGSGFDLMLNFQNHAKKLGVDIRNAYVDKIERLEDGTFKISTAKESITAKTVILATGTTRRKLNVPGEEELSGKGVAYCATCDAFFYRGKDVAVVGGGDAATMGAEVLANVANKVHLIHRRDTFRGEQARVEQLKKDPKVEFILNAEVERFNGTDKLESVTLKDGRTICVDGCFIEIGGVPATQLAADLGVELNEHNIVKTKPDQSTNIEGVFAAGDITTNSNHFEQTLTAAAEGAIAANGAFVYLRKKYAS